MSPLYTGNTCLPVDGNVEGRNCTLGGYPVYVLTARNPRDVQAGVNFARNHNIRLIVKNTGHDFAGKVCYARTQYFRSGSPTTVYFSRLGRGL